MSNFMSNLLDKKLVDVVPLSEPLGLVFGLKFMNGQFDDSDEPTSYAIRPPSELLNKYKELRRRTGLGLAECKRAYEQAEGDMDQAVLILKALGPKRSY